MIQPLDGFWLPERLRSQFISTSTSYSVFSSVAGRESTSDAPGVVSSRWPILPAEGWADLLAALQAERRRVPHGEQFWLRLQNALVAAGRLLSEPTDEQVVRAISALPGYTGFSPTMLRIALSSQALFDLQQYVAAYSHLPTWSAAQDWQEMPGLSGRLRFFPSSAVDRLAASLPGRKNKPLFGPEELSNLIIGFGAGNVPGTALQIVLQALSTTLAGGSAPAVLVKNSRREPIFSPMVLSAIESVDPDLLASTAVLVWDYQDLSVNAVLLSHPDLVMIAAGDETIAQVRNQIAQLHHSLPPRYHAHGHKFSFAAITRDVLDPELTDPASGLPLIDIISFLGALDSVMWDQYGCLSARFHFVESGGGLSPLEYAIRLELQLRSLANSLPRGAWPRQQLQDNFDRLKLLEPTGQVKVLSGYDDPYVVALDERPLSQGALISLVNACLGRVIIVRPVADWMEIPEKYLSCLPPANLQSLSLAAGKPGQGFDQRLLEFATACARRGVTAIRSLGRGAFPQLAYSWDGLLPLDMVRGRPSGHFTTIEFSNLFEQILENYHYYSTVTDFARFLG